jgi:HK97 family phage portal protein
MALKQALQWLWTGDSRATSPENPATSLSDPAPWLVAQLGGAGMSDSGVPVSPEAAMRLSAVYACIRVIAEDIASLPLHVYRPLEKRGKARAVDAVEYSVLHDAPNPLMTSVVWRELQVAHVLGWGNAYSEIETNRRGDVIGLWPIAPWCCKPRLTTNGMGLVYRVTVPGREVVTLPASKVLHVPGLSFDGVEGFSVIGAARNATGLGIAAERFGSRFFSNASRPAGALKVPPGVKSKEAAEALASWNHSNAGLDNAGRTALLMAGAEWQKIGLSNEEAQYLELRKFQVTEIARMFRVPPHMIADLERATFSNIEHQSLQYVMHTLRPWLVRFEQEYKRKIFAGRDLSAEYAIDGLIRGDIKARSDYYVKGRQWGWLSANDIRDLENLNPIEGGDTYLTPMNMVDAAKAADPADPADDEGAATQAEGEGTQPAGGQQQQQGSDT